MIIVTGTVTCDPAQARDYVERGRQVSALTRAEPGCISHDILLADEAAGRLVVIERWRDEASLKAHLGTPHVAAFGQASAGVVKGSDVVMYTAQDERSLATLF